MFDAKDVRVVMNCLEISRDALGYLEKYGVESDELRIEMKRVFRKCQERAKELEAKSKSEAPEAEEAKA